MMSDNNSNPPKGRPKRLITRKQFLTGAVGGLASAAVLRHIPVARAQDSSPIKLGFLLDLTGLWAESGIPTGNAAQLAISEINAAGGVLGRELESVVVDAQSETERYVSMTRIMIGRDRVNAIFGGGGSQNREAMRPIAHQAQIPYFYPTCYEGGVADSWTFCTGVVPEQGFATLVPSMIEKYGPRVYDLAADYVWGQLSSLWLGKYVEEAQGEIVGTEAVPLNVSDFSATLGRIQQANPDWIYVSLTGREQAAFFSQRVAQGVGIPISDFVITLAQSGNHRRMNPPVLSGLHETFSYVEELEGEANADFVSRYRAMFPDEVFITQPAQNTYNAIRLYAMAAELAGTIEPIEVVKALESGLELDAPEGRIRLDPATHHVSHTVHLAQATEDHSLEFLRSWENIEPFWLREMGVDLTTTPDNRQYSPLDT
jgi:urea transport system substrate-binding protein